MEWKILEFCIRKSDDKLSHVSFMIGFGLDGFVLLKKEMLDFEQSSTVYGINLRRNLKRRLSHALVSVYIRGRDWLNCSK